MKKKTHFDHKFVLDGPHDAHCTRCSLTAHMRMSLEKKGTTVGGMLYAIDADGLPTTPPDVPCKRRPQTKKSAKR